ncbi:heat shock protein Hsp18 [Anaerosalibacter massiliensis]|uniref:Hsp20/alpha crystallin family protein n=1 Tax=Anaerosalibacter massiliensis TaxID=1347392 RepID=A0A9X2S4Y9_9FIRM|nr:heat shock protein Hsp18 [Anaerosalibacter massiliensis]MCR2044115.1 Hsp20/alpha crystallin family protein [Anaerosalibacter massiliensis]
MFDVTPFRKNNLGKGENFVPSYFRDFFDDDFFSLRNYLQGNLKVDLKETSENYLIDADLPGIKKEDINIDFHNNYLVISAKRNESTEDKKENYIRRERHYGEFKRSFYIDNVDESKISASFNDGVLKIILPKINNGDDKKRKINID